MQGWRGRDSSRWLWRFPAGGLSLTFKPVISFIPHSIPLQFGLQFPPVSVYSVPRPAVFLFIKKTVQVTGDPGLVVGEAACSQNVMYSVRLLISSPCGSHSTSQSPVTNSKKDN